MTNKIDTSRDAVAMHLHRLETRGGATDIAEASEIIRALLDERDRVIAFVWKEAAKVADAYAAENQQMAADSIHFDPVLGAVRQGDVRRLSEAEEQKSDDMQMDGLVHSSMFRAAKNIAAALRARGERG
ncbi:hypothetical protein [Paracoccus aerius]|uniref:Uncharacterized protein n=1 Tax=Paracoccus aerius TaxID=1915382 RepID=A0ABS1S848_9RHOB|nr:hypothetical protein [Paracoccus aerius]MBL3674274.1 hypothetical protein [Paracoccus aerius]GHG24512.1 hypothetical protein GCM10017322_23140 [Paracoccus aerius]